MGWIQKYCVLILSVFVMGLEDNDDESSKIIEDVMFITPLDWPWEWNSGIIPYAINFFSPSPKRLLGLVKKGIDFMEKQTCLTFEENNPIEAAEAVGLYNFTYLYFSFSGVLEDCCLKFYSNPVGRRTVLITPVCSQPHEVAHAILHGLGLVHSSDDGFTSSYINAFTLNLCQRKQRLAYKNARAMSQTVSSESQIMALIKQPITRPKHKGALKHYGFDLQIETNNSTPGGPVSLLRKPDIKIKYSTKVKKIFKTKRKPKGRFKSYLGKV